MLKPNKYIIDLDINFDKLTFKLNKFLFINYQIFYNYADLNAFSEQLSDKIPLVIYIP